MNGHLMRSGHFGALMESFYGRRSGLLRRTSVSSFPAPYWLLTSMGHQCDSSCSSCPATCGLILTTSKLFFYGNLFQAPSSNVPFPFRNRTSSGPIFAP